MATTSKLSFRARNLDASKPMPVYIADELPDLSECTPINRAVAQMPTGMEKDEEMELHLQEAIIAQQASTSGIAVENHLIPTPKVSVIDEARYNILYPIQPAPSKNQLIKVQASLSVDKEQPEYDVDTEDEAWLAERGQISAADFEKMMELLEGASSDVQICQPKEARSLLRNFNDDLVDDVYDYWLQKRKDAAGKRKVASLIPRVRTDNRRDAPGSVNPYVAFRRRAEKMQTRKNRKNDEDSYEKTLKLCHDFGRAVTLFDMVRRRERTKAALIELDEITFDERWASGISNAVFNQILAKVKPEVHAEDSQDEGTSSSSVSKVKSHKRKKHGRSAVVSAADTGIATRAWLKKNAEAWNRPPVGISTLGTNCSTSASSLAEAERTAAAADTTVDGRYAFKRRRGCMYRESLATRSCANDPFLDSFGLESRLGYPSSPLRAVSSRLHASTDGNMAAAKDLSQRFYRTLLPSTAARGFRRCIGFARRRVGRGGRIIFDRLLYSPPSTSQCAPEELNDPDIDFTRTYQSKTVFAGNDDDSDEWSVCSDEERAQEELAELEYARREELFRTRIYEKDSETRLPQGMKVGGNIEEGMIGPPGRWSSSGFPYNRASAVPFKEHSCTLNGPRVDSIPSSSCSKWPVVKNSGSAMGTTQHQGLHTNSHIVPTVQTSSNGTPAANEGSTVVPSKYENYLEKRPVDSCVRVPLITAAPVTTQQPQPCTSDETRSIFYPLLPPPAPIAGLEEAGGQNRNEETNGQVIEGARKRRNSPSERRLNNLNRIQQDRVSFPRNVDNSRSRVNGVKRSKGSASPTIAQRASALVAAAEATQKRLGFGRLNGEPAINKCVDTKRLELAIVGSGARIKAPNVVSNLSAVAPVGGGIEMHTPLIEVLKGSAVKGLNGSVGAFPVCTTYSAPHFTPAIGDAHVSPPHQTSVVNTCYPTSDNLGEITSSPDSESMSPPMSTSPAVVPELPHHFGVAEPRVHHPVAIVSSRPSTTQADSRHGGLATKVWLSGDPGIRKRSYDGFSQLHEREMRSPPRGSVAAVPRPLRQTTDSSAAVSLPSRTADYSQSLASNDGEASPGGGVPSTSPSPIPYFTTSKLATHNDISVSEGPLVG